MAKSILAGLFIGLGAIVNLSADNRLVGAFMFSLGLLLVIIFKADLFTGKIGYFIDEPTGKNALKLLKILIGNVVGVFIMAMLVRLSMPEIYGKLCLMDFLPSDLSYFVLAIPCGALMYLAVEGYKRSNSLFIPMLCVATFIVCGFQHCIVVAFYSVFFGAFNFKLILAVLGNTLGAIALRALTKEN